MREIIFEEIDAIRPRLFRNLQRHGVMMFEDREDIVQEALARLYSQLKRKLTDSASNSKTFVVPITHLFRAINDARIAHSRRARRHAAAPLGDRDIPCAACPDLNLIEACDTLCHAFKNLPETDVGLIQQRYFDGQLSLEQLARHLRVSKKTVCHRLNAAMHLMLQQLRRSA